MSIHSASNKDGFLRRTFCFSLVAALLLVAAHRLPAPISEIPEPTATPEVKPKPARDVKAEGRPNVESRDAKSNPAHSFNGVWEGSSDITTEAGNSLGRYTLVITNSERAALTVHVTATLKDRSWWVNLPKRYESVPQLQHTISWNSRELHATDSTVTIQWNAPQLVDWDPKTIPYDVYLKNVNNFKIENVVFTLSGSELSWSTQHVVFHRVR